MLCIMGKTKISGLCILIAISIFIFLVQYGVLNKDLILTRDRSDNKVAVDKSQPNPRDVDLIRQREEKIEETVSPEHVALNTMEDLENIQRKRKLHVNQICKQYPELMRWNNSIYDNLLVDDTYKIIYCAVPKVANSNWRRVFLVLRGSFNNVSEITKSVYKYKYKTLKDYTVRERQIRLQTYTKFMFSRHPFTRILSAYKDKFEEDPERNYVEKYTSLVNKANKSENLNRKFSFQNFVTFLLLYIHRFDNHWNIITSYCSPCNIHYDFIGKYETLNEDVDFILKKINVFSVVQFPSYVPHSTNSSSIDILRRYYSELTQQQLQGLYNKYKTDFNMFDYDIEDYLNN
ncbi:carbohydrate sulfotransferase 11-like [Saccoglossus kowalevskii]|uniref:Carbohydrate sulfotransferase n=1 Tax=Saccoglossus kowalevskii TaxID=10224 RepID=A0ABM0M7W5_SACKO|nr:PREDICTED: carbohydrate sulfotransferase 11-like [Saccoglossus kowalevskii]